MRELLGFTETQRRLAAAIASREQQDLSPAKLEAWAGRLAEDAAAAGEAEYGK